MVSVRALGSLCRIAQRIAALCAAACEICHKMKEIVLKGLNSLINAALN